MSGEGGGGEHLIRIWVHDSIVIVTVGYGPVTLAIGNDILD